MEGKSHSEDTKRKISLSKKGVPNPELSKFLKGRPQAKELIQKRVLKMIGRKQSSNQIENRAKKLRGKKRTDEQKLRISLARKGIPNLKNSLILKGRPNTWTREALLGKKNPAISKALTGKKQSEETKRKRSISLKLSWEKLKAAQL
jgi:hypothetical protein